MFLLMKKPGGAYSYDLYVNGFHMPDFYVTKETLLLIQKWDDIGKLQIMEGPDIQLNEETKQQELTQKILEKFAQIIEEENNGTN